MFRFTLPSEKSLTTMVEGGFPPPSTHRPAAIPTRDGCDRAVLLGQLLSRLIPAEGLGPIHEALPESRGSVWRVARPCLADHGDILDPEFDRVHVDGIGEASIICSRPRRPGGVPEPHGRAGPALIYTSVISLRTLGQV